MPSLLWSVPFTVSHPAAVLPFLRTPLPTAALVIGAMAPDLVFFVPLGLPRSLSHSLLGGVTVDPALGVLARLLWWMLLRAPVLDLGPRGLRERMAPRPGVPTGGAVRVVLLVLAALLVGIATHLAWDWFTHPDGLASIWTPWRIRVGPLLLTSWLQYASSVVGAAIILIWSRAWWHRTAPDRDRRAVAPRAAARLAVGTVIAVPAAAGVVTGAVLLGSGLPGGVPALLFRVAVVTISVALAAVTSTALAWWVARMRRTAHPAP